MTFYQKLQPLEQFEIVCMVAGILLLSAVILREYFNDREIRIVARLLGAAGFAVMMAFSWRMAFTVERLEQIARVQRASEIADQGFALAGDVGEETTAVESSITTQSGTTISFTRRGSSLQSDRRCSGWKSIRSADFSGAAGNENERTAGIDDAINAMPHAISLRFIQ